MSFVPVFFTTSSTVVPGAISRRTGPSDEISIHARSEQMWWTQRMPVRGSVHSLRGWPAARNFVEPPSLLSVRPSLFSSRLRLALAVSSFGLPSRQHHDEA